MAKKKLNHHLYQDKSSGVWYFQKKVRGMVKPYKFSLETTSVVEARRKRDKYLREIELHGQILRPEIPSSSESMPFGEVALKWSEIVKARVEETTFDNYRKIMNNRILPAFGNLHIDTITGLDIEVFISKLKCGSKTKQNILTPFRDVMRFAKKHKIIQTNPFVDVEPIKKTKNKKKRPLSLDEIRVFLANLDDFWKPLFIFLFFKGARIAEAAGLKWKCVDLVNGEVKIRKNLVYVRGKSIYKRPKTESSIRDIKLPKVVIEALRDQRKRTWKGSGDNFVFLNKIGGNIHRQTLNHLVIGPTLKKAGIASKISIKDTRASYITNALDKNERMSFIQKQVGHTTTRMIVDHYYRYVPAPDDGKRLEDAWNSTSILPDQDDDDLEHVENTV
jgi:integrase